MPYNIDSGRLLDEKRGQTLSTAAAPRGMNILRAGTEQSVPFFSTLLAYSISDRELAGRDTTFTTTGSEQLRFT